MIITSAVLALIGLVCLYGIAYYTFINDTVPGWTTTPLYNAYIDSMNHGIYPFIILLLVALGLCIPKRIVPRQSLLAAALFILGLTIVTGIFAGITAGLTFLLAVSLAFQTAVMVMTVLGKSGLTYEREGYLVKTGSSMLHLGVVLFVFDFAGLRENNLHLAVFWAATILITIGTVLSFYPVEIGNIFRSLRK